MVHPCLMAHFDGASIPGVTLPLERTGPRFLEDTRSLEAAGEGSSLQTLAARPLMMPGDVRQQMMPLPVPLGVGGDRASSVGRLKAVMRSPLP